MPNIHLPCYALKTHPTFAIRRSNTPQAFAKTHKYLTKNIEDIRVGDLVLAREEYGTQVRQQRVEETFKRVSDHLRILDFTDASGQTQTIKTTDEHPFWIADQQRFINAGELKPGATVIGPAGELQTLATTIREIHLNGIHVYNFSVAQFHTYFVSEEAALFTPLLVHNSDYNVPKSEKYICNGFKDSPGYPQRFRARPGNHTTRNNIKNQQILDDLRQIERGD